MDEVEQTMEENIVQSEQPEVAPQESTESQVKETHKVEEQEDTNARNWRRANETRKRLEQELKKKEEQLEQLLKAVTKQQQPPEVDELDSVSADEFIPKGKIEKMWDKREKRIREQTREEVERAFQEKEKARWKEKVREKFPDFEDVVNVETLDLLEQQEPEVAENIADLKDPYKVAIQSYKYIKAMGLTSDKVSVSKRHREVEKKLDENKKTIQSPQVYDKRPLAQAYKITDADHKALYKEMMEAAGQSGFSF